MSDPGTTYRNRDEIASMRTARDPIEFVKNLLVDNGLAEVQELKEIEKDIRKEVQVRCRFIAARNGLGRGNNTVAIGSDVTCLQLSFFHIEPLSIFFRSYGRRCSEMSHYGAFKDSRLRVHLESRLKKGGGACLHAVRLQSDASDV